MGAMIAKSATTVHECFEQQAKISPDAIALVCRERQMSYADLNSRASRLAVWLQTIDQRPEAPTVICMQRSIELIIGMLGVLKSGGAFVPIDSAQPAARIASIIQSTKAGLVLVDSSTCERVVKNGVSVCCLESDWWRIAPHSSTSPSSRVCNRQVAYIMFTSGSTAQPKGVMIEHSSFNNYIHWARQHYFGGETRETALFSSIGADLTLTSIFVPLVAGGRLHIYQESGPDLDLSIFKVLHDGVVNVLKLTPSHLSLLRAFGRTLLERDRR
jgi:non-ribosomal peptide synthetase component F